jgi:hypothetical protein
MLGLGLTLPPFNLAGEAYKYILENSPCIHPLKSASGVPRKLSDPTHHFRLRSCVRIYIEVVTAIQSLRVLLASALDLI